MDLERRLRTSLGTREPSADFADAVLARVRNQAAAAPARRSLHWRLPATIAATVLAAASGLHWHAERQRAFDARDQLLLALAITSSKLDQVQQRLVRQDDDSTQENGT